MICLKIRELWVEKFDSFTFCRNVILIRIIDTIYKCSTTKMTKSQGPAKDLRDRKFEIIHFQLYLSKTGIKKHKKNYVFFQSYISMSVKIHLLSNLVFRKQKNLVFLQLSTQLRRIFRQGWGGDGGISSSIEDFEFKFDLQVTRYKPTAMGEF